MIAVLPARVHEIVALDEQVLRNLSITDAYHRLALDMAELVPAGDLTWPGYATWASKQAGVFIRQEGPRSASSLPPSAKMLMDRLEAEERRTVQQVLGGIARFIVAGSVSVFEELGFAFASFVEAFEQPSARTEANLAALIDRFSEGESHADEIVVVAAGKLECKRVGGQGLIREALRHYFESMHEPEIDPRSELLLLANVECGLHEQIRLQPYFAGALDGPVEVLLRLAGIDGHPHAESVVELARQIAIELLLVLPLPHEVLDLGSDIEAPPGSELWPAELTDLDHPTLLELSERAGAYETRERELPFGERAEGWFNTLMSKIELARPEAQGTGAQSWARLDDRLRFMFEFYRSRQRDMALLTPPFSPESSEEIAAGRIPRGPP